MSPMDKFDFPDIRPLPQLKKLSSSDLRKLASISGIDAARLEQIASGRIKVGQTELEKIAKALGGLGGTL